MQQHIVILGAGFAGLTALKTLRKRGYRDLITLVSPHPTLFYYPSLIWVPMGLKTEQDLTVPLDKFFKRYQVTYHQGQVEEINPHAHTLQTSSGSLTFDGLIIATGSRFIKKLPGIEHIFIPCEGYAPVQAYTEKLRQLTQGTLAFGFAANPFEPAAMRGGPIFEFMLGLDTWLRQQNRRNQFKFLFFSPAKTPGQRLGENAVTAILGEMRNLNIETYLGHKLTGFDAHTIHTEGGDIHSDLTLFMPGLTAPEWVAKSSFSLSEGGFIKANEYCQVLGFKNIYVAGDTGSFPGPDWLPKQAHVADLQAAAAATNLLNEFKKRPVDQKFSAELICIIDTYNSGLLVYRDPKRALLSPKSKLFHQAKRFFEWYYLRAYR